MQKHEQRSEFWHVIAGTGKITVGEESLIVKGGDEVKIGVGVAHRVECTTSPIDLLEIAEGTFDEHDEVRLKDEYGRA